MKKLEQQQQLLAKEVFCRILILFKRKRKIPLYKD